MARNARGELADPIVVQPNPIDYDPQLAEEVKHPAPIHQPIRRYHSGAGE